VLNQRRPKVDWSEIKAAYQSGKGSCRELSEQFGVSYNTVRNKCAREKWNVENERINSQIKAQVQAQVAQKVVEECAKAQIDLRTKFIKGIERDFQAIENVYDQSADLIEPSELRHNIAARKTVLEMAQQLGEIAIVDQKVNLKHSGSVNLNVFTPEVLETMAQSWERFEYEKFKQQEEAA